MCAWSFGRLISIHYGRWFHIGLPVGIIVMQRRGSWETVLIVLCNQMKHPSQNAILYCTIHCISFCIKCRVFVSRLWGELRSTVISASQELVDKMTDRDKSGVLGAFPCRTLQIYADCRCGINSEITPYHCHCVLCVYSGNVIQITGETFRRKYVTHMWCTLLPWDIVRYYIKIMNKLNLGYHVLWTPIILRRWLGSLLLTWINFNPSMDK